MTERTAHHQAAIDLLRRAVDATTTRAVFGEPISRGEITVIPVARVVVTGAGGGGGGGAGLNEGGGAGCGLAATARPVGMVVLRDDSARWQPIIDVNKVIFGGQVVGVAALLVARALIKAYRR
jgi:uncharacterized spore protein YtfJ